MCADAQRDSRPAEYRWRPQMIERRKVWLTPLLECRAVTLPYENTRLGGKVNFAPGKFPLGQESPKMYIVYHPRRRPNIVQGLVDLRGAMSVQ